MHRLAVGLAIVVAMTDVAAAHQSSVKYAELQVDGDALAITFRVSPSDVTEPMGLRPDATPPAAQAAASTRVGPYVARWLAVSSGGAACTPTTPTISVDADARFVVIEWRAQCGAQIDDLVLDFTRFFAVDPRHVAIVRLDAPDSEPVDMMVGSGQPVMSLHVAVAADGLAGLRAGIEHIESIRHHACFVIALLLVVILERRDGWQLRAQGGAARRAAIVVGAFTAGHVASWLAAGWIHADPSVVSVLAALSVGFVVVDGVVRPDARWRPVAAAGFGLVHGLAFAGHGSLVYAAGVELAQLAMVLIAFPLIAALARAIGALRYRRIALPAISMAIALVAFM